MKKSVLFVDDDQNMLDALRRMLRPMALDWNQFFVRSGDDALVVLAQHDVDVVMTDMRMPGMDGGQLLKIIQEARPDVVRIVLSGHADYNMVMRSVKQAHQFLTKPCSADDIRETLERAYNLRRILTNEAAKNIVTRIESLPSLPDLYLRVVAEVQREDANLATVARIISEDPAMTAAILKMVNSSFFGFFRPLTNPAQAVNLLGTEIIKGLILSAHLFSVFDFSRFPRYSMDVLVDHSMATGRIAGAIATFEGMPPEMVDECFIAGMLHDVGKLILASRFEVEYLGILATVRNENRTVWEVEREVLSTSHAELGAYLLGLWNLPGAVVDALAFHHEPGLASCGKDFTPLTAVHAANALEHELRVINKDYAQHPLDPAYLEHMGLTSHLPQWKEICDSIYGQQGNQF